MLSLGLLWIEDCAAEKNWQILCQLFLLQKHWHRRNVTSHHFLRSFNLIFFSLSLQFSLALDRCHLFSLHFHFIRSLSRLFLSSFSLVIDFTFYLFNSLSIVLCLNIWQALFGGDIKLHRIYIRFTLPASICIILAAQLLRKVQFWKRCFKVFNQYNLIKWLIILVFSWIDILSNILSFLQRLTDLRFLSIDFLNTFLLTYRVFAEGVQVLL